MKKIGLLTTIVFLVGAFFYFDLQTYFSFEYLQASRASFSTYVEQSFLLSIVAFFMIYVLATALSLPGAALLTLAAGALFGLGWGVLVVSFASSIGATLAFMVSRYLLRDSLEARFQTQMKTINEGIDNNGAFYLFTLRLIPAFPFFMINLVMGLTQIKWTTFFLVSQAGMLAGTIVFVNAGTQLAQLDSVESIASPSIIASFLLLALFPWIAKFLVNQYKRYQALKGFKKPKKFDRNLVVIGAGAAGLVASYIAAAVKAKVTLIEKNKMGGDCLNTGCVPSKALIRSAKVAAEANKANQFGVTVNHVVVDFAAVMERVQEIIKQVEPHDSVERYTDLGVECVEAAATILSPYEVQYGNKVLTTRNIIIATGARPRVPNLSGLDELEAGFDYFTSDSIWQLREQPKRLLVLGGGPIGCELAQAFARLGSQVIQIEKGERLLSREDQDVSDFVEARFQQDGIQVETGYIAQSVVKGKVVCQHIATGQEKTFEYDVLLFALGRVANTTGFGLESLDIELNPDGTIAVDEHQQTSLPGVFASGDVAGPYQFTHVASHQSWYASVNALFGFIKRFKVDYRVIPRTTFIDPEVARVGLNEKEALKEGLAFDVTKYAIDDLDRAIADGAAQGFVKVLTPPKSDRILGVTIVGQNAGELLAEYVLAMKHGLGLNKILSTIHTYPTMAEANKYAAGEWKRNNAPQWALSMVERLHCWRRG